MAFRVKRERGFAILTVVVATLTIVMALTATVALSRTGVSPTSGVTRSHALAVIAQGDNLAMAFQRMMMLPLHPREIMYYTTNGSGARDMFNPNLVSFTKQVPPDKAFASTAPRRFWMYKATTTPANDPGGPNLKVPGIGTTAGFEYAFILPDLDVSVCQEINRALYNTSAIDVAGSESLSSLMAGTDVAPTANINANDLAGVTSGRMQACVATNDDPRRYVYYVVVEPT